MHSLLFCGAHWATIKRVPAWVPRKPNTRFVYWPAKDFTEMRAWQLYLGQGAKLVDLTTGAVWFRGCVLIGPAGPELVWTFGRDPTADPTHPKPKLVVVTSGGGCTDRDPREWKNKVINKS
jgi:hypothetical protein